MEPADSSPGGGAVGPLDAPTYDAGGQRSADRGARTLWVVCLAAVVVLIVDQLAKLWAVSRLEGRPGIELAGQWLSLTFVRNPGAAFSLGAGSTLIVSLLAVAIVGFLLFRARNLRSVWWAIAMGGMIGGALGNLVDRVFRTPGGLKGHVVDFIAFPNFPVFNVADMAVVGSAILMVILALLGIDFDGNRPRAADPSSDGDVEVDASTGGAGKQASAEDAGTA